MNESIMKILKKKAITAANPYQEKVFRKLCKKNGIITSAHPMKNKSYPTYFILMGKLANLTAYENQYLDGVPTSVIDSGFTPMSLDYFKRILLHSNEDIEYET